MVFSAAFVNRKKFLELTHKTLVNSSFKAAQYNHQSTLRLMKLTQHHANINNAYINLSIYNFWQLKVD